MKTKLIISAVIMSVTWFISGYTVRYATEHRIHILHQVTNDRGLISVQYIQDGREYAQDYLTETEY